MIALQMTQPLKRQGKKSSAFQFQCLLSQVSAMVRVEVAPLMQVLKLILQKLDIPLPTLPQPSTPQTFPNALSIQKEADTRHKKQINPVLEAFQDKFQEDLHLNLPSMLGDLDDENQVQFAIHPRGNNAAFNPNIFPQAVPYYGMAEEHRGEWESLYGKVKRIILGKQERGERGWFDFQKKILLEFVIKGAKFGCSARLLTQMVGVSSSTFKRWRNFFT